MKNLKVEAAVLDLRHLSEETLASYEKIEMEAALVLTGPDTEALLAKHSVELSAAMTQRCDVDTAVNMVNGKMTLSAARKPEGPVVLIVNGKLDIAPDAAVTSCGITNSGAPIEPGATSYSSKAMTSSSFSLK